MPYLSASAYTYRERWSLDLCKHFAQHSCIGSWVAPKQAQSLSKEPHIAVFDAGADQICQIGGRMITAPLHVCTQRLKLLRCHAVALAAQVQVPL